MDFQLMMAWIIATFGPLAGFVAELVCTVFLALALGIAVTVLVSIGYCFVLAALVVTVEHFAARR